MRGEVAFREINPTFRGNTLNSTTLQTVIALAVHAFAKPHSSLFYILHFDHGLDIDFLRPRISISDYPAF